MNEKLAREREREWVSERDRMVSVNIFGATAVNSGVILAFSLYLVRAAIFYHTSLQAISSNNHPSDFPWRLLSILLFLPSPSCQNLIRMPSSSLSPCTKCTLPPHACCYIKPHSKLSVLYKCFLIDSNSAGTVGADIRKRKSTTFMNNAPQTQNRSITECKGIINTACYWVNQHSLLYHGVSNSILCTIEVYKDALNVI